MDVLERQVVKGELVDGEYQTQEVKKIKEIIDLDMDVWEADGRVIITHNGVLKLAEFVGATWDEPRLDDRPRRENDNGFYYLITCRFPDGSSSFESGEASDLNTDKDRKSIDYRYKQSMALKRGMDRSFLRSTFMKLYDVYSEEEAEYFKNNSTNALKKKLRQAEETVGKFVEKQKRMKSMVFEFYEYVALDDQDAKYPKEYVVNVWRNYKDLDYLKQLLEEKKGEKVLHWSIQQIIREAEQDLEEEAKQSLEAELESEIEASIEEHENQHKQVEASIAEVPDESTSQTQEKTSEVRPDDAESTGGITAADFELETAADENVKRLDEEAAKVEEQLEQAMRTKETSEQEK